MAIEIPNSAAATCEIDISAPSASFGATADSILASLQQELMLDGLTIAQKSISLTGLIFPLTGEFKATIQILNQSGQELDDTDLTQQFMDACNALGLQVNSFAVTQVNSAPSGINSGTGTQGNVVVTGAAPQAAAPVTQHVCGDPSWNFAQDPVQWVKCLTQGGLTTVGLLAIGLLIGVVLIVSAQRRPTPV